MQDQASVKQVQEKLSEQGYDVGPVDGIFGPKTQQALRKFQEDKGVQPTGQIDQQTMAALGIQGEGGAQPGDMGAGQPQPDTGIEGSDQPGSDLGSGAPPDAGTQSPDAGAQGSEQQGSDAGALQQ
jgi:peptidoglycan hydrolase-like protein with peptidoglycan-binding domain